MSAWLLTPLGPIVARDGRPFGADSGNRMKPTPWLYPSVAAGSLRTMAGKRAANGFDENTVRRLKNIAVAGPLPCFDHQLYFPTPKDIVLGRDWSWLALRPSEPVEGEGTDLPSGLLPVTPPESVSDFKPPEAPPWWSLKQMTRWLFDEPPAPPGTDSSEWPERGFMASPGIDLRTHVALKDDSGAADDGLLFQTSGFLLGKDVQLAVRMSREDDVTGIHPFGGERRLAAWERGQNNAWGCPPEIANALANEEFFRMILATPAIFSDGWKPGWLGTDLRGRIPGTETDVRLVGACVERWKPISGWSLDAANWGEKPVRRLAPAGSVYFFKREGAGVLNAADVWLQPVSDDIQSCLDGFGLALWGRWKPRGEKE